MKTEKIIRFPDLDQLVEPVAVFIASSNDRIRARLVVRDAIEHQLQEIDTEALRFLAAGGAPDAKDTLECGAKSVIASASCARWFA